MDILTNTPWWVFVLFIFLTITGLNATRPRVLPLKRLIILPTIFALWNIAWLAERIQGHFSLFIFWLVGLIVGSFIGWQTVLSWRVHADHVHRTVALPGTWSTLFFIVLVFFIRYFFVYNYEAHPEAADHLFSSDALLSGIITGIFIGRVLEIYRKYRMHQGK